MKLTINLLDIENGNKIKGYKVLPSVSSFDDVPKLIMISSISLGHFYNENEARQLMNKFPKSYRPRLSYGYDWDEVNKKCIWDRKFWDIFFSFNFVFTNKTTGDENEAAINRLHKVIKRIKEII